MTITYFRDIPVTGNDPSVDQPNITTNNNSVDDFLLVDHIPFNSISFQNGYHNVIHQPPQNADPVAIPGIGQTYPKTVNGDQQLFFESGAGVVYNLTNSQIINNGVFAVPNNILAPNTIFTMPNNCIGLLMMQSANGIWTTFGVSSIAGTGYAQFASYSSGQTPDLAVSASGLDIKVATANASGYNSVYKYILWIG